MADETSVGRCVIIIIIITLIPWHGGRSLVWDVTVVSPLAASYIDRAATDAGTVADMTATRKKVRNTRHYLLHTGSSL